MGHLPFMQFFPADWLADTRCLSLEARGVWIDLLCAMWTAPERGKLDWTIEMFENFIGYPTDRDGATSVWNELLHSGVGVLEMHENGQRVTVMSRRMCREENIRKQAVERQSRHRHGSVTGKSRRIYQKSEVRSHISDTDKNKSITVKPEMSVQEFVESWNDCFAGSLPKVDWPINESRRRKIAQRLKEHQSLEFWKEVFKKISTSRFLLGSNNGSWRANIDWLTKNDSNCLKVYEGSYDNGKTNQGNSQTWNRR